MAEEHSVQTTPSREDKHCTVEGCKRPHYRAKGYCNVHYKLWRHGKLPNARYKICTKEGCRKPRAKGNLCQEHLTGGEAKAA